jgi:FkbM family methyltransferase
MQRDLIYDIGLHRGLDSKFYMQKGFRVIGIEASSPLCMLVRQAHPDEILQGQLTILERALHRRSDEMVSFFINPEKDDWGSLERGSAEKGIGSAVEVAARTICFADIVAAHGVPYYIKCDIEGGDAIFVESLLTTAIRPAFVSIEATSADDLAGLRACGYDKFQIVNQYTNPWTKCPFPAREGKFVDATFTHETSGLFGRELAFDRWDDFAVAMKKFIDWFDLRNRDPNLAIGWLDVHCCMAASLSH